MEEDIISFYDSCLTGLEIYYDFAGPIFDSLSLEPKATSELLINRCNQIHKEDGPEIEKSISVLFIRDALLTRNVTFEKMFFTSGLLNSFENILQLVIGTRRWEDVDVLFETEEGSRFYIKILLLMFQELMPKKNPKVIDAYGQLRDEGVPFVLVQNDSMLNKPYYKDDSKQSELANSQTSHYSQIKSSKKSTKPEEPVRHLPQKPSNIPDINQIRRELAIKRQELYTQVKNQTTYKQNEANTTLAKNTEIMALLDKYPDTFTQYMVSHIELTSKVENKIKEAAAKPKTYPKIREELLLLFEHTENELKVEDGSAKKIEEIGKEKPEPLMEQNLENTSELYENLDYDDKPLNMNSPFKSGENRIPKKNLSVISEIEGSITQHDESEFYDFNPKIQRPKEPITVNEDLSEEESVMMFIDERARQPVHTNKIISEVKVQENAKPIVFNEADAVDPHVVSFKEYFNMHNDYKGGPVKSSIRDKVRKVWDKPKPNIVLTVHQYAKQGDNQEVHKLEQENNRLKNDLKLALMAKQNTFEELKDENKKLKDQIRLNEMEYVQKVMYMEKNTKADNNNGKDKTSEPKKIQKVDQAVYKHDSLTDVAEELKLANDDMCNMIKDLQWENVR